MSELKEQSINTALGSYFIKKSSLQLEQDIEEFEKIAENLSYLQGIQIMSYIRSCTDKAEDFRNKIQSKIDQTLE